MKLYVLLAHPDKESFNGQLADAYCEGARAKGHEVRIQRLGDMRFDPILWKGLKVIQQLEPDLLEAQQNISWCERWVIVYPMWWGSVPALFKGFLDRTLHPGFAYKYHETGPWWDKLLKGRSAHIITTCDSPSIYAWWQYRNSDLNAVKQATLKFCGISPVKVTRFDRVRFSDEGKRARWVKRLVDGIVAVKEV